MGLTTRWMQLSAGLALGAGLAIAPAQANPRPDAAGAASDCQLVLPFTDVSPDDWAYQALLNLAGVYNCISGYPDGTFRGDSTITRFEFAAGMDACLNGLARVAAQRAEARDREVQSLLQSMEESLSELRQLESDLPEMP